jgi:hypothetical protein
MLQAKEMMLSSYTKHFQATFTKKDGSKRLMNCVLRPPKDTTAHSPAFYNPNLVVVGDLDVEKELLADGMSQQDAIDHSYRSINTLTLVHLIYDGVEYEVE